MKKQLVILLLVCPALLAGQTFSKRYDLQGELTSENSFNIEGTSYGYIITRVGGLFTNLSVPTMGFLLIDEEGNQIDDVIHGSDTIYHYAGWANSGAPTSDGYFIGGGVEDLPNETNTVWLFKYDEAGDTLWTSTYGQPDKYYYTYQSVESADSGYIVIGYTDDFTQAENWHYAACLLKFGSQGEFEWIKKYTSANKELWMYTVAMTEDGGFLLGGKSVDLNKGGELDHIVIKTDSLGNEQWREYYGNPGDEAIAHVAQCSDGHFIFSSFIADLDGFGGRPYIAKIDSADGDILWEKTFHSLPSAETTLHKVIETEDGGFVSAGTHEGAVMIDGDWVEEQHGLIVKVNADGDSLWTRLYVWESPVGGWLRDIIPTGDGGYIACGQVYANDEYESTDTWVLKMDEYGCVVPGCQVSILEQEQTVNFITYPNPAIDVLNIYFESLGETEGHFRLFNTQGQMVREFSGVQTLCTYMLDVAELESGCYLLQYSDDYHGRSMQIMIQH